MSQYTQQLANHRHFILAAMTLSKPLQNTPMRFGWKRQWSPASGRGVNGAVRKVAEHFRETGISTVLTGEGYRFYFCNITPRHRLPQLAATYAAFFYLGSISRYKPDAFESLLSGGFSWVVHELIATGPVQFVYTLASELAGVDVVRPYAADLGTR